MRWIAAALFLVVLSALPSRAQLTIENPKHLDYPKDKAEVLYRTACRVVAEEFRVAEPSTYTFPLTLVLGTEDERYTANDEKHTYVVYLRDWDEQRFASSTMMLAIHRLLPRERQQHMLAQIIKRAKSVVPVSVNELQSRK